MPSRRRPVGLQRVGPAHALEPAHERLVGRVEEDEARVLAAVARRGDGVGEHAEPSARAHVDDDRDLLHGGLGVALAGLVAQVGQRREQLRRQVVDDEPAEVLEHVGGRRAPGTAHAR